MFKRSEESEWSRFSKAFTGKDEKGEGGEPVDDEVTTLAPEAAAASSSVASPSARQVASESNFTVSRATVAPAANPAAHPVYNSDDVESVIGEHSSFDGTYRSESSIRIRGTAEGEIECAKAVFVEENAKVSAKVTAASIMVAGEVNGELNCSGRVEIRPTGRVTGQINASVLIMQEGAFFDGNLKMKQNAAQPEPAIAASSPARLLYLLVGRDEFQREEFVGQLKTLMRKLPMGEHNIDELDGTTSVRDLVNACNTTPFLCDKRMVIARGLVSQANKGRSRARGRSRAKAEAPAAGPLTELLEFLPQLPETTHLVLVEDDPNSVQPLVATRKDTVRREFTSLRDDALPGWISERVRKHHTQIARPAAQELAQLVGADLRALDSEIAKLATYVDAGQQIEVEDVRTLVSGAGPGIFAFQDALAERRPGAALAAARGLMERGSDPAELFAQVVGLVRRLLVVKELTSQRRNLSQEAGAFGLSTSQFALQKLQRQAGRLSLTDLERAYRLLHDTDLAIKTGKIEAELAVELVVAEIAGITPSQEIA